MHSDDRTSATRSASLWRSNGTALSGLPAGEHLKIAILVKNFQFGGTQRVLLRIANRLAEYGHHVQLLSPGDGPLEACVSPELERISITPGDGLLARALAIRAHPGAIRDLLLPLVVPIVPVKGLTLLQPLAAYLAQHRPAVMISATASHNVIVTLAKRLAKVSTRLVLTEHVTTEQRRTHDRRFARRYLPALMRGTYRDAAAIVGVSSSVSRDLRALLRVPEDRVTCIFNPAVPADLETLAVAPVAHRWFQPGEPPVVLSAGRPSPTKDYSTLLQAFAKLRRGMPARLVILSSATPGSVQCRYLDDLRQFARDLHIAEDFEIIDFTVNPFSYMARAGVFALASTSEGFGNVVAESLACGCPVVSTCTPGPNEVLAGGCYGRLVAIGDVEAMTCALRDALVAPRDTAAMTARAQLFSEERAALAYQSLCQSLVAV
jgi:glycosyltransferase involved in cell wall biosynthesis